MNNKKQLGQFIIDQDLDGLVEQIAPAGDNSDDSLVKMYEWLLIAEDYNLPGATDLVKDIYYALVSRWGDETGASCIISAALAHFSGQEGLPINEELGFRRLEQCHRMGAFQTAGISVDIEKARSNVSNANLKKFDQLTK